MMSSKRTGYFAFFFGGNLGEGTNRKVDAVPVIARWALIGDGDRDGLPVVRVGDLNLLAAKSTSIITGRVYFFSVQLVNLDE